MDLSSFYSSPRVLFWLTVAGAYGLAEAILRAIHGLPKLWIAVVAKWHNRSIDKDYYYAYRESGYRILNPGNQFLHIRSEKIIALKHLEEMPISFNWSGEGEVKEKVIPESLKTVTLAKVPGYSTSRRRISLTPPLEKGQSTEYTYVVECKQIGKPPEPFLGSRSSHRVDVLVLRVVFPPTSKPKNVFYVKRNADLVEVDREHLKDVDHLTGAYSKRIEFAEPHLHHRIEWE